MTTAGQPARVAAGSYSPPDAVLESGWPAEAEAAEALALIQLSLAGLADTSDRDAGLGRLAASPLAKSWPFSQLLADLADSEPAPALDIGLIFQAGLAGTAAESDTVLTELADSARTKAAALWDWFEAVRRRAGDWPSWWRAGAGPVGDPALAALPACDAAAVSAGGAGAEALRALAGWDQPATAESTWRRLVEGGFLQADVPGYQSMLGGVVGALRGVGLLPAAHRIRAVGTLPTRAASVPIRIPGETVLVVHDGGNPSTLQYLHHELAHVAEHAARPPDLPLTERWTFDPVLSEGWALLIESLVQDPEWLALLGFGPEPAGRLAAFFQAEERVTRQLIATRVAFDARAADARDLAELEAAAERSLAGLPLAYDPVTFLFGLPNALQWRAYHAGFEWRDRVVAVLGERCQPWWDSESNWQQLAALLTGPMPASAALARLSC